MAVAPLPPISPSWMVLAVTLLPFLCLNAFAAISTLPFIGSETKSLFSASPSFRSQWHPGCPSFL